MSSSIENLPLLVLESVCEYLATIDMKRQSLFAFSLASKHCWEVSSRERFQRIRISVRTSEQLLQDLNQLDEILNRGERTRYPYIHRVGVTGRPGKIIEASSSEASRQNSEEHDAPLLYEDSDEETSDFVGIARHYVDPLPVQNDSTATDQLWQPLGEFLCRCRGLKHVVWASSSQVPLCIMKIFHEQLPTVRLHINTFSLRSLYQKADELHDIDDNEYAVVTSPNLASIWASSKYYTEDGDIDYKEEAILQMVRGFTPNLTSVSMSYTMAGGSLGLNNAIAAGRPPWPGFYAGKKSAYSDSRGRLQCLKLGGPSGISWRLKGWIESTDFSELRSLSLLGEIEVPILNRLVAMAEASVFKTLRKFSYTNARYDEYYKDSEGCIPASNRLLSFLAPLERIRIAGTIDADTLITIQLHHGETLRKLALDHVIDTSQLEQLRDACPNLHDLSLRLLRTQGDQIEVRTYQLLGSFSRLKRIALALECEADDVAFADDYEDGQNKELQIEAMRSALINSAVDSNLAEAIFQLILAANRKGRSGINSSFQYLKLTPLCPEYGNYLTFLMECVALSWVCERKYADATSSEANIEQIKAYKTEEHVHSFKSMIGGFEDYGHGQFLQPTWQELWPESKGKKDWVDVWRSFPLVVDP